jgi:hypothetical protein
MVFAPCLFLLPKRRIDMKRIRKVIFPLLFSLVLVLSTGITAFAAGDGNIDGGGGGMGSGTATDVWHGQDGVRITVVTSGGSAVSTPFDLSNSNIANNVINFGKVSKLSYTSGTSLSPNGYYSCSKPGVALPRIISGTSSRASIEAIRRYFCSEYAAQLVSDKTGIAFDDLISGDYKLVIEPIAYFTHGGRNYAMTATEAALYNQMSGGTLRSKMPSLTHQNLPLSIFLETADLGYPAWTGTTSGRFSSREIILATKLVLAVVAPLTDTVMVRVVGSDGVCHFAQTTWEPFSGITISVTVYSRPLIWKVTLAGSSGLTSSVVVSVMLVITSVSTR